MALIECPECSKNISDRASACPHCGYAPKQDEISNSEQNNEIEEITWDNLTTKVIEAHKLATWIIAFAILIAGLIASIYITDLFVGAMLILGNLTETLVFMLRNDKLITYIIFAIMALIIANIINKIAEIYFKKIPRLQFSAAEIQAYQNMAADKRMALEQEISAFYNKHLCSIYIKEVKLHYTLSVIWSTVWIFSVIVWHWIIFR